METPMVLTSHDQPGNTVRKTGFWLEEFAAAYFVFQDAGVELTLASPKGEQPPLDPKGDLPKNQTPVTTRFKLSALIESLHRKRVTGSINGEEAAMNLTQGVPFLVAI